MTPRPPARSIPAAAMAALAVLGLATAASAFAQTETAPSKAAPSKAAPSKAAPSKAAPAKPKEPPPDPNVAEKEFTITLMSGAKIKLSVFPNPEWPGKIVRFEPFMEPKENNIHSAALNSMWEIYGRQRGSFTPQDGALSAREGLAGQVIVYKLKTGAKLLIYPIRDEATKSYKAMRIWME